MGIQAKMGFYYEQVQEGFYYDNGFYYDQQDAGFNQGNVDYWKKGDGRKVMLKALNSLRTEVDDLSLRTHLSQITLKAAPSPTLSPHRSSERSSRSLSPMSTLVNSSKTEVTTKNLPSSSSENAKKTSKNSTTTARRGG